MSRDRPSSMGTSVSSETASPGPEPGQTVPANVRHLIQRHIRSATEIELLLLLHRAPETFWAAAAASAVVGAREEDARAHLGRFEAAGLVERGRHSDAYRFAPASEDARSAVAALATAYAEHRNDVLRVVIGSLSQITAFSDAFRLSGR